MDIVDLLIKNGANVNVPDNQRNTPLHLAAELGNSTLWVDDSRMNMWNDEDGFTLLDREEVTELLIENDADMNMANEHGETPLHAASRFFPSFSW